MTRSAADLETRCPDIPAEFVREFEARMEPEYFDRFDGPRRAEHVRALHAVSPQHPVDVLVAEGGGRIECTVAGYDAPGVFSLITGVLASLDFDILSGDVFTYRRQSEESSAPRRVPAGRKRRGGATRAARRRILDHFSGETNSLMEFDLWAGEVRRRMEWMFGHLEDGGRRAADEVRQQVNEWVTGALRRRKRSAQPPMYPVDIELSPGERATELRLVSQDTPAFLYAVSTALTMQRVSIEHVDIRTSPEGRIEDVLRVTDRAGRPIREDSRLNRLRLSVILTKQFTYHLDRAPDPYTALVRFEQIAENLFGGEAPGGEWAQRLSDPRSMQNLARVLGTSDYLWEDVIRLHYESLAPVLEPWKHMDGPEPGDCESRLRAAMEDAGSFEEKAERLNRFKDRELFDADLRHILHGELDVRKLSASLTPLAEAIVKLATETARDELTRRHGTPRTVGGLEVPCAVFGLGKMGGRAIGYASDIELLFLYSDRGRTDGEDPRPNAEFFNELVDLACGMIRTKREGIFEIDLRLRPHGQSGPKAVSLESFCRYYGPGGTAHAYERLALVRLRAVAGERELGAQVERLRDEFVYHAGAIDPGELRELRKKQFEQKCRPGCMNAKFSPGGLVDLEYTVQLLQVAAGVRDSNMRTPYLHRALDALRDSGELSASEHQNLAEAYRFFRALINGLRMLRGSARDLYLPEQDSPEFGHLARRMGYRSEAGLEAADRLTVDVERHSARVRHFVEVHLGREALPVPTSGTLADLILDGDSPEEVRRAILGKYRFTDPDRAFLNLQRLAGAGGRREIFFELVTLAGDVLRREPDPDRALNNWERFLDAAGGDPCEHYAMLFAQPQRLRFMLGIFSRSQFLAEGLIRSPEELEHVTSPEILYRRRDTAEMAEDVRTRLERAEEGQKGAVLYDFRFREILRIGTRDMILGVPVKDVTRDLSMLADAVIRTALEEEDRAGEDFAVFALGKLGGRELNYSSDIDLLAVCDPSRPGAESREPGEYEKILTRLRAKLGAHPGCGYVYRVDLRLRPHGRSGPVVPTRDGLLQYYRNAAALWERQSLLKLRCVAGSAALGREVEAAVRDILLEPVAEKERVFAEIEKMRGPRTSEDEDGFDIKQGRGGIRDIEFLAQGLQLVHAPDCPDLPDGNTRNALEKLAAHGLLDRNEAATLQSDYAFLRRAEHYLQILEDRQIHRLPENRDQLASFARCLLGADAAVEDLIRELNRIRHRVTESYQRHIYS
ncbi:hypothetical protein [Kiritimatiella glycovorans]|uniref:Glutamate-ammonia-ligase adenylyltransferase n=1 Tax=Kiritimatiella glycovorans TaxID=1307763 RepID=A0A0G3EEI8_9BACT|nr:hypothetical protein [Kiritimatiella glycovorans]AKJ64768.1 Glutamate-ammonia-ligase adenylyltransferase [Kiritimatiella glycovorans]